MKNNEVKGKKLRSLKYIKNGKIISYKKCGKSLACKKVEILKALKIFKLIIFKYLPFY